MGIVENSSVETSPAIAHESRWMVDESKGGFAIDYTKKVPDWVEIGLLVSYRVIGYTTAFNLAEIKSVRKLANGSYRAGFKKISHNVAPLTVSIVNKPSVSEPVEGFFLDSGYENSKYSRTFSGLLIDNDVMLPPKLLLPRKKFKRGNTYIINFDGDNHEVKTGRVMRKHNNWVLFEAVLEG